MSFTESVVSEGCLIRALPRSRVVNVSATGSTDSHRVRTSLTLSVTRMHFSSSASSSTSTPGVSSTSQGGAMLQITGRVIQENPYVKMGAFHTLDIEVNRDVKISKGEWDSISLERVTEACAEGRGAEVGAIVCGEGLKPLTCPADLVLTLDFRYRCPMPTFGTYDSYSSTDRGARTTQAYRIIIYARQRSRTILQHALHLLSPTYTLCFSPGGGDCQPRIRQRRRI